MLCPNPPDRVKAGDRVIRLSKMVGVSERFAGTNAMKLYHEGDHNEGVDAVTVQLPECDYLVWMLSCEAPDGQQTPLG
jgi:predicted metalloprotease